ncbi:hypothetical protein ACFLT9_09500 [Acidobacteriota bacterium]
MAEWKNAGQNEADQAKLDTILQPSTVAKEFKITVEFGYKVTPSYKKAVDIARRSPTYTEEGEGEWIRHSATFMPPDVEELFELFNLVHEWDSTEVLVNHKKIPYGHQLWLPLMWFNRIK